VGNQTLETLMEHYGISPWELEVAYGYFNSRFVVIQKGIEWDDPYFVSVLNINIPLPFTEKFFDWFDFRRWEKVKALFKEMKRRRGSRKGLKIQIKFLGRPTICFILDAKDKDWFNNSAEKIDFVLELLPYHLEPKKLPENVTQVNYRYDEETKRWSITEAYVNEQKYLLKDSAWKISI